MENVKNLLTTLNDKTQGTNVDKAIIEAATKDLSDKTAELQNAITAIVV